MTMGFGGRGWGSRDVFSTGRDGDFGELGLVSSGVEVGGMGSRVEAVFWQSKVSFVQSMVGLH